MNRESLMDARSMRPRGLWWMRRKSEGFLYWHAYKTAETRDKWARIYYGRDDAIWMRRDGSDASLFVLRDEEQWRP
jgi:hypothetical protein